MINARFTVDEFKKQPEEFRIGAVISDGMWYSLPKWKKIAKVSEEAINEWIEEHLSTGMLVQAETGAKSYRFPYESIKKWYRDNNLPLGEHDPHDPHGSLGPQLIDFLFPPRIWGGMTETEGFLRAPLREIAIVSFSCSSQVADEVREELRGVARVRENEPNHYKAYCLEASVTKEIVEKVFKRQTEQRVGKIYSRAVAKRRELADFSPEFAKGLVLFYQDFGRTLVKKTMDTISIFLPDPEDQNTQVVMWVIAAIEKFDETTAVPFSGYLNTVLKRWPYDLPYTHLGKELSNFQRERARAIGSLKEKTGKADFTAQELSEEVGMERRDFDTLEERHKVWLSARSATTLTWEENGEEKVSQSLIHKPKGVSNPTDITLAHRLSFAVIQASLTTERYEDAFAVISQMDASDINFSRMQEMSEDFVQALGAELGIEE